VTSSANAVSFELADEPVWADADRSAEADRIPDRRLDLPADEIEASHEPLQPGDVQIRLVAGRQYRRPRHGLVRPKKSQWPA
jgi:hypothetical protein